MPTPNADRCPLDYPPPGRPETFEQFDALLADFRRVLGTIDSPDDNLAEYFATEVDVVLAAYRRFHLVARALWYAP